MFYSKGLIWVGVLGVAVGLFGCSTPLPLQRPTPTPTGVEPARTAVSAPTDTPQPSVLLSTTAPTDTATLVPTLAATAVPTATEDAATAVVVQATAEVPSSEEAWRAQQANRQEFGEERRYTASAPVPLLWFDSVTGQRLEIGQLIGGFVVTAQFELRFQENAAALAVPYRIDQDYGLTAISPAVKARMQAAGYTERVEAFVLLNDSIAPANS